MMGFTTIFLILVTMLVFTTPLLGADRCREICEKSKFQEQCGSCQARAPVRFGKRSGEIQLRVKTSGERSMKEFNMKPCCNHLLSLLMQRAAQYTGDSAVQFELEY